MVSIRVTFFVWLAVLACVGAAHGQAFEVVDLGTLPGASVSIADAIQDDGQVVGRSGASLNRIFVWTPGVGMRDLIVPNPVASGQQLRTNRAGQIAGLWTRNAANRPFLWNGATFVELPDPAPGWVQRVQRLTDGGMVLYEGPASLCNQLTIVLFGGVLYQVDQVLGACWAARDVADGPVVAGYRLIGGAYQAAVRAANGQVTAPSTIAGGQALFFSGETTVNRNRLVNDELRGQGINPFLHPDLLAVRRSVHGLLDGGESGFPAGTVSGHDRVDVPHALRP